VLVHAQQGQAGTRLQLTSKSALALFLHRFPMLSC